MALIQHPKVQPSAPATGIPYKQPSKNRCELAINHFFGLVLGQLQKIKYRATRTQTFLAANRASLTKARYSLGLALPLLISACTSLPPQSSAPFDPNAFLAQGKIALRYPHCPPRRSCEEKGLSASFDWQHQNGDSLTLYDPLGQVQLIIERHDQQITLTENGQRRTINTDQLAAEIGIALDFHSLHSLIFTQQPSPTFEQNGWQVSVKDWQGQHYRNLRLRQNDHQLRLLIYRIETLSVISL